MKVTSWRCTRDHPGFSRSTRTGSATHYFSRRFTGTAWDTIASLVTAKTSESGGLIIAVVVFVLGWVLQFVGHKYEGVKPAFVDDIVGLAIGPLFVMTELFFILRLKSALKKYVEDRVGPVMARRDGAAIGPANSNSSA